MESPKKSQIEKSGPSQEPAKALEADTDWFLEKEVKSPRPEEKGELKLLWEEMEFCLEIIRKEAERDEDGKDGVQVERGSPSQGPSKRLKTDSEDILTPGDDTKSPPS